MAAWFRDPAGRRQAALLVLLALVFAGAMARYASKIQKLSRDGKQTRSAFLRWRDQVEALTAGEDIYRVHNYPNPPVQALILTPLTWLDRTPGALVWFALKIGMAACAWVWAVRLCTTPGGPIPLWARAVALIFTLHPVLGDLDHGNVNIFIAFLVFGALECARRHRDAAAGLVLALAVACKVTPALFLPYFVWKRCWKLVAATLAGCVLWLAVVPAAALGWDRNQTLLTSWFDQMVRPFLIDGKVTSQHANQSLPGLTMRLLVHEPSDVKYDPEDDGRQTPAGYHNLTDIGPANARLVVRGCQVLYVLAGAYYARARLTGTGGTRQGLRVAAEYAAVCLGMLLFSERTWKHHGVVLMLPNLVIAAAASTRPLSRWARIGFVAGTAAVFWLILGPSLLAAVTPAGATWDAQDLALTYGSHTAVFVIMLATVGGVLVRENRRADSPPAAG